MSNHVVQKQVMHLGIPYLKDMPDEKVRLCAELVTNDATQTMYFEVDSPWKQYLVTELSDAFILGILEKAMKNSYDIFFEQPMSEDLYYSLRTYLIPVYARNFKMFHKISLYGKTTAQTLPTEGRVGTGFSAGVDSFYTVLKHLDDKICPHHNITHLMLAVNGAAATGVSEDMDRLWLESSKAKFLPYAKALGLKLVCVGGNIDMLYVKDDCLHGDIITTAAFVYALQKLYGTYYWASAYQAEIFNFTDGCFCENVAVPYVSTRGIRFYHSGSETNRVGKVAFIADHPLVQKGLTVCGEPEAINCGCCVKCLRTMAELNAVGKLEMFQEAFPVKVYQKHIKSKLAQELAVDHPPFTTEMKKNDVKIPFSIYPLAYLFYKPLEALRKKLRRSAWIRRLFYRFDFDLKLLGRKQTEEERKRKLNGVLK
ncbi:MAG: hypothetical protein RR466_03795 [Hungatella sp.]